MHLSFGYEFSWDSVRALEIALYRTYCIPSISKLLDSTGEFYQHTLMTDFFNPGPNPHGNPPVFLAAVGERMAAIFPLDDLPEKRHSYIETNKNYVDYLVAVDPSKDAIASSVLPNTSKTVKNFVI